MSDFRLYNHDEAGKDGYPEAWHATLKHLVRELAGHRCVRCLHPYKNGEHGNGEWTLCDEQCRHRGGTYKTDDEGRTWAAWRILTVHHLDGYKLNCRWWNLAALCQRCHLTIQGRVKLHRPWLLDHSEWFRPYVAGYYAWSRLGEDLTREQTMERLDELLAMGRALSATRPLAMESPE